MENNKERVLAYVKAKEIDLSEQEAVSGGRWWTSRITGGGSAASGQGGACHLDGVWDF